MQAIDNVGSGLLARLASEVNDLKCDFIAIIESNEADVQDFSANGHGFVGLEQAEPKDISDDDEEVAKVVDQFVIQNTYTEPVGGDDDDSVEAALQSLHWVCNYLKTSLYLHLCDWISLLQCIQQLHVPCV